MDWNEQLSLMTQEVATVKINGGKYHDREEQGIS
jgi:hypothetical protein